MSSRVFVDTSAFIALADGNDPQHEAAKDHLGRLTAARAQLIATNYVVVETTAVIQRKLGFTGIHVLENLLWPMVEVHWISEDEHKTATASLLTANRRQLSLVDCTSFVVMRSLGIRHAFHFDLHFDEQGFSMP